MKLLPTLLLFSLYLYSIGKNVSNVCETGREFLNYNTTSSDRKLLEKCNALIKILLCPPTIDNQTHSSKEKITRLKNLYTKHCSYLFNSTTNYNSTSCNPYRILDKEIKIFKTLKCNYAAQVKLCSQELNYMSDIYLKLFCTDYLLSNFKIRERNSQYPVDTQYMLFLIIDNSLENSKALAATEIERELELLRKPSNPFLTHIFEEIISRL